MKFIPKPYLKNISRIFLMWILAIVVAATSSPFFDTLPRDIDTYKKIHLTKTDLNPKIQAREISLTDQGVNYKNFKNSEGGGVYISTTDNENYLDENNNMKKIDNTFVVKDSEQFYTNKANNYTVKLNKNSKEGLIKVQNKDYWMTMDLVDQVGVEGKFENNNVTYKNILPSMDVRLSLENNFLKEDLIFNEKPTFNEVKYNVKYSNNLSLFSEKGEIVLKDKSNKPIFFLPKPNYDLIGNLGKKFQDYKVSKPNNNSAVVSFNFDNFINFDSEKMIYPFVVDPSISIINSAQRTYIEQYNTGKRYTLSVFEIGSTAYGESRAFMKFDLGGLPADAIIDNAIVELTTKDDQIGITRLQMHRITSNWDQDNIDEWSDQPAYDANPIDRQVQNNMYGLMNFDVTDLARNWKNGSQPNFGVAFTAENLAVRQRFLYTPSTGIYIPKIILNYHTSAEPAPTLKLLGEKSWWEYADFDFPQGSSAVNIADGNVYTEITGLKSNGLGFSSGFSLYNNSKDLQNSIYGYGWNADFNEKLIPSGDLKTVEFKDSSGTSFVYKDPDGNNEYVDSDQSYAAYSSGLYSLEDKRPNGNLSSLRFNSGTNQFEMTSPSGGWIIFDRNGNILLRKDKNNNTEEYVYSEGRVTTIKNNGIEKIKFNFDIFGRLESAIDTNTITNNKKIKGKIKFTYTPSNDLESISYLNNDVILTKNTFGYVNHKLTNITDNRNNLTQILFDASGRADKVINAKNEKTEIQYLGAGYSRVVSAKAFETGAKPVEYYATDYYFRPSPYFLPGIIYKEIGPKVKDDKNVESRPITEYTVDDDFSITTTKDPQGSLSYQVNSDMSGVQKDTFNNQGYLINKNVISPFKYFENKVKVSDSYGGNNQQTSYYYDGNNNILQKSINDGESSNLFLNSGFETNNRKVGMFDLPCSVNIAEGSWLLNVADGYCPSGQGGDSRRYAKSTDSHSQGYSQYVGVENSNGKSANLIQILEYPIIEANTQYTLSYYYKNTGSSAVKVQHAIDFDDSLGNSVVGTYFDPSPPAYNTNWQKGTWTFTTPSGVSSAGRQMYFAWFYIRVAPSATGVTGGAYFDSIRLEKGNQSRDFTTKTTKYEYYPNGLVDNEFTPENQKLHYAWDDSGNILSLTDSLNKSSSFTYDANGNRLSKTDASGNVSEYEYNSLGMLVSTKNALGAKTQYTYDEALNLKETIFPNPNFPDGKMITGYNYDSLNRPETTNTPYGYSTKVEYDKNGNPIGVVTANGLKSSVEYDGADRLTKDTDSTGKTTSYAYDNSDQLKIASDTAQTSTFEYDKDGQVKSENSATATTNKTVTYAYDKASNIVGGSTEEVSKTATYLDTNEILSVKVGNEQTKYYRNKNNQILQIDKANGDVTKFHYTGNALVDRIEQWRSGVKWSEISYTFDNNGNRLTKSDSSGTTRYIYDKENQLLASIDPTGKRNDYIYTISGNLTKKISNNVTITDYGSYGNRMAEMHTNDGITEKLGYDPTGNITSRDKGDNISLLNQFENNLINSRDRLNAKVLDNTDTAVVNPAYIAGKYGQALSLPTNQYFSSDSLSNFSPNQPFTTGFWFKLLDSESGKTRPLFTYTQDEKNSVKVYITPANTIKFDYTAYGKTKSVESTNTINFDGSWQFVGVSWKNYALNLNLNSTSTENILCTFSADDWQQTCKEASAVISYIGNKPLILGMDASTGVKNFANISIDGVFIKSEFSDSAKLLEYNNKTTPLSLAQTTSYTYDSEDYLSVVYRPDGTTINYTYDTSKRLIKRVSPTSTTTYGYDDDVLTSETTNSIVTKYIYDMQGSLLHIDKAGVKYYPVMDGLGSILALRDSAGNTVGTYAYDDWGKVTSHTGVSSNINFASYWYDEEVSLYHLGARWYDASLGRFLTPDPHPGDQDDVMSINEYLYTGNNPINRTDPDGDSWKKIAVGLGIAALGIGIGVALAGSGGLLVIVAIGAISGGATSGGIAYATGGNVGKAIVSGALIGGATAGVGGVAGTLMKAGKAAKKAYVAKSGSQLAKGTSAHSAWTKVMKKTIRGTYNKAVSAGSKSRMDYRFGKTIGLELKTKAQVKSSRTIKQVAKYRKNVKLVFRLKY